MITAKIIYRKIIPYKMITAVTIIVVKCKASVH